MRHLVAGACLGAFVVIVLPADTSFIRVAVALVLLAVGIKLGERR